MVLGGPWWKSIQNSHYSCQIRIFTSSNSVWYAVRPVIYFLIGLHCGLQLHWVTSEWSCLIASHCIYDSWVLCRCHFGRFAQLSRLLTWHVVLLQLRDRPSSKSCGQASGGGEGDYRYSGKQFFDGNNSGIKDSHACHHNRRDNQGNKVLVLTAVHGV